MPALLYSCAFASQPVMYSSSDSFSLYFITEPKVVGANTTISGVPEPALRLLLLALFPRYSEHINATSGTRPGLIPNSCSTRRAETLSLTYTALAILTAQANIRRCHAEYAPSPPTANINTGVLYIRAAIVHNII